MTAPTDPHNNPLESSGDGYSVNIEKSLTPQEVKYFFDLVLDADIPKELACKAAEKFNKNSYYVDLDFDCDFHEDEDAMFDIYGSATEAEICLD